MNLQLSGKISLKFDSNSSLLLEYGCKSISAKNLKFTSSDQVLFLSFFKKKEALWD